MKRLLLPLLAALALPTSVNAEEFTEIKPKNIYSYKKSSLVKWESEKNGNRYIGFIGTTLFKPCFADYYCRIGNMEKFMKQNNNNELGDVNIRWPYQIDCVDKTFNRLKDFAGWGPLWIDQTAMAVAEKYCPIEEWSKLPNK